MIKPANIFSSHFSESINAKNINLKNGFTDLITIGNILVEILQKKNKILFCGNGGSCSDAQHIAAELIVQFRKSNPRKAIPGIALSLDSSTMTACANDLGYKFIFSRAIEAIGRPNDCLFILSTSGNSPNILEAAKKAKDMGLIVISFLGNKNSLVDDFSDYIFRAQSEVTAIIQEIHITAAHALVEYIEEKINFNL